MTIAEIIKYEGDNDVLICKAEQEDFNCYTQLIVHESQEAVFFHNGQALDTFRAGKYTLETESIPLLKRVFNLVTGSDSPFHSEVYFVNIAEQMNMLWGTEIDYNDPVNNDYLFKVGSRGSMSFRVSNSRKLLMKLVGTQKYMTNDKVMEWFKIPLTTYVKSHLSSALKYRKISVFELDLHLKDLSEELCVILNQEFEDYGITVEKFWIEGFKKPEQDPIYRKILEIRGLEQTGEKEANIKGNIELIEHSISVGKRRMDIDVQTYEQKQLNYTYQQKRGFDVAEKMAENEGSGSNVRNDMMNMGMGFGMMGSMAGMSGKITDQAFSDTLITPPDQYLKFEDKTDERIDVQKNNTDKFTEKVEKLKIMYDKGILSDEEFEKEKRKLLQEL